MPNQKQIQNNIDTLEKFLRSKSVSKLAKELKISYGAVNMRIRRAVVFLMHKNWADLPKGAKNYRQIYGIIDAEWILKNDFTLSQMLKKEKRDKERAKLLPVPKIHWHYQYLEECKEIFPGQQINIKPDEHDRWAVVGSIYVKTKAMPEYKWVGKTVSVPICWIGYIRSNETGKKMEIKVTGHKFKCEFPNIKDANIGYGASYFYGKTPREVMEKIEKAFAYTFGCLTNAE